MMPLLSFLSGLVKGKFSRAEASPDHGTVDPMKAPSGFETVDPMLRNLLEFPRLCIKDVMVPRADIKALDETNSLGNSLLIFEEAGHSRLPTYRGTLDNPTGMVHIKDLVGYMTRAARIERGFALNFGEIDLTHSLSSVRIVRPVLFAPPSMSAADLFGHMQASRTHLVLVVDEYGGTEGLVSIEDLVEQIVGDIEDEHDPLDPPPIVAEDDGVYVADARASIKAFCTLSGESFSLFAEEEKEGVDTLGGLVFSMLGRVPVCGELVLHETSGFEFEVLDADARRVKKLKLRPYSPCGGRQGLVSADSCVKG